MRKFDKKGRKQQLDPIVEDEWRRYQIKGDGEWEKRERTIEGTTTQYDYGG